MVLAKDQKRHKDFDSISVSIASPEQILKWSHGEVTKPETINYRTQKPERDGLFCERIFGPTKNWECYCGKYKKIIYKGVICEKCGVEVTRSSVRRERMAHIELAVPVAHIWFLRSTPSRIGLLLDIPIKGLEQVVYFAAYIIKNVDDSAKQAATDQLQGEYDNYVKRIKDEVKSRKKSLKAEFEDLKERDAKIEELEEKGVLQLDELGDSFHSAKESLKSIQKYRVIPEIEYRELSMKFGHVFSAGIGAEAIREIISEINMQQFIDERKEDLKSATEIKQKKIFKRIKLAASLLRNEVKPEWMVMTQLPVLPPDLRPMVQLDGGRYAASDLNDLYRRVINRNNRLKKLLRLGAPEVICRNEKRMLQEAVDTLLNNSGRSGKAAFTTADKRKLRSLSDMLKGKQGRFRQNLLGKRVDYSGRSVIVVGPSLRLNQCGIPKEMAMKLFKPFVLGRLIEDGMAHNVKNAERVVATGRKEVWDILEEVTQDHYVLLNRAPTLHRLSIQAFQPVLIDGKAIQIHPLVCTAFNADFDGDQMAVHVPLSDQAQKEAREVMRSSVNLLKPSAGEPITAASQDMVMGCYFLTRMLDGKIGEGKVYGSFESARLDYDMGGVNLLAKIKVYSEGELIETSVGRIIFNEEIVLAAGLSYKNQDFGNKDLKKLLTESFNEKGVEVTARMSDAIKDIGFKFATLSGLTISVSDLLVPVEREKFIEDASALVKKINDSYWKGFITAEERYNHNIRIWAQTKSQIMASLIDCFAAENEQDLYYQIESGARGNWGHITQMCGMKGLVANPSGKTIELPILSNLKEGFSVIEYFISTHGGRKGKSDTALKTAEAGYLTRRLVDAVQDIIIREKNCGHNFPMAVSKLESKSLGVSFERRIMGRTVSKDILDSKKNIVMKAGDVIGVHDLEKITEVDVDMVEVRSIMTCRTQNGICQACYGMDLSQAKVVELGTAVGIIAAQSIGEPGTQLTMRTFHMGGVAEGADITQGLPRVEELFEARPPKRPAILADLDGKISLKRTKSAIEVTIKEEQKGKDVYPLRHGFKVEVKEKDLVREKQIIIRGTEDKVTVRAKFSGVVKHITKGEVLIEHDELKEITYKLPPRASILVSNGDAVEIGDAVTAGHFDLREYVEKKSVEATQFYIMREVQSIYASQGQLINDKHIEIIVKQMFSKVRIVDPGSSDLLYGEVVDIVNYQRLNASMKKGQLVAYGERILLGLTRIALNTDSWLAAASFQETIRVLVDAAVTKRVDNLDGLKENVIIGRLINAGKVFRQRLEGIDPFEARGEEEAELKRAA